LRDGVRLDDIYTAIGGCESGGFAQGEMERNSGVWFVLPSSHGAKVRVRLLRLAAARIWGFFISGVGVVWDGGEGT